VGLGVVDHVAEALARRALVAASSLVGGRLGVSVARRLPAQALRYTVALYGTAVAVILLTR